MGRRGEKIFTTWDYKDREVEMKVPVTLVDEAKKGTGKGDTFFRVRLEEPEISERDSDINRLRETVFKQIKEKLQVEWRPMLVVVVTADHSRLFKDELPPDTPDTEREAHADLRVKWERWQIAEHQGTRLRRSFNNYYEPWHGDKEPPREVWNSAQPGWPGDKNDDRHQDDDLRPIMAMIPDTPANRAALEAIADQIENLYHNLARLLAADKITETLAHVAGSLVLNLGSKAEGSEGEGSK